MELGILLPEKRLSRVTLAKCNHKAECPPPPVSYPVVVTPDFVYLIVCFNKTTFLVLPSVPNVGSTRLLFSCLRVFLLL